MNSKGSVWYHPQQNMLVVQTTYEPMMNDFEYGEAIVSMIGIVFYKIHVHDPALLGWEYIGQLLEPQPDDPKSGETK